MGPRRIIRRKSRTERRKYSVVQLYTLYKYMLVVYE